MKVKIPQPLKLEHEELHAEIVHATKACCRQRRRRYRGSQGLDRLSAAARGANMGVLGRTTAFLEENDQGDKHE